MLFLPAWPGIWLASVCPAWGSPASRCRPSPAGAWVIAVVDDDKQAGALEWHPPVTGARVRGGVDRRVPEARFPVWRCWYGGGSSPGITPTR